MQEKPADDVTAENARDAQLKLQNLQEMDSAQLHCCIARQKGKEKTTPFGVNLMRTPVLYRVAQA